jgi:hypothetical protein
LALQSALRDDFLVFESALDLVGNLQNLTGTLTSALLKGFYDENAAYAYAAVTMVSLIGRDEQTDRTARAATIESLVTAARDPRSRRGIYKLTGYGTENDPHTLVFVKRLDASIAQAALRVAGML